MKSKWFKPPFDLFGITPQFYVRGKRKNATAVGICCGFTLMLSLIGLFITYYMSYKNKEDFRVTSSSFKSDEFTQVDIMAKEKYFTIHHYPDIPTTDINKLIKFSAFMVLRSTKGVILSKREIPIKHCSEVTFKNKPIPDDKLCIMFDEPAYLGRSEQYGAESILQVEATPCTVNCSVYPGDAAYESTLADLFSYYYLFQTLVGTAVSDYGRYDSPIMRTNSFIQAN